MLNTYCEVAFPFPHPLTNWKFMGPTHCDLRAPWGRLERLSSINRKLIHWPFDLARLGQSGIYGLGKRWGKGKVRMSWWVWGEDCPHQNLWKIYFMECPSLYAINMISICHQLCKASRGMWTPKLRESFCPLVWVICRTVIGLHRRMQHLSATPPDCLMSWPLLHNPFAPLPRPRLLPVICPLTRQLHSKHSAQSSQLPTKPKAHRHASATVAALVLANGHTLTHSCTWWSHTHSKCISRQIVRVLIKNGHLNRQQDRHSAHRAALSSPAVVALVLHSNQHPGPIQITLSNQRELVKLKV